jgi:hypothetical protein
MKAYALLSNIMSFEDPETDYDADVLCVSTDLDKMRAYIDARLSVGEYAETLIGKPNDEVPMEDDEGNLFAGNDAVLVVRANFDKGDNMSTYMMVVETEILD